MAQDYAEAVKWLRKAAEQNFAEAQRRLGYCYENGQGMAQDYVEAVKWYRKAAEQNAAYAQCNLGFCYAMGQGVLKVKKPNVDGLIRDARKSAEVHSSIESRLTEPRVS